MIMTTEQKDNETKGPTNGLLFFKEVAKYFMDFLESDFHKKKLPRRTIEYRNNNNLLVGLNLQKYESFNKLVWKLINQNFDKEVLNKIEKGVYQTQLPKNLLDLVKLQVDKVNINQVNGVIRDIAAEIEKLGTLYGTEYDVALNNAIEVTQKIIHDEFVAPFIKSIENPLQNLTLGDEEDIFHIEEELSSVLTNQLESKISEILNLYIAKEKVNIEKELKSVFTLAETKGALTSYFEDLQVADLFAEVFEMDRNKSILNRQEFYLYFGDISFNKNKYPIFYVPVSITRQKDILFLDFDSQIYINKKALEYIVQECNVLSGKMGNLKTITERIIYLAQHKEDLNSIFSNILNEIQNFFETKGSVNFEKAESLVGRGATVRVTNSCYLSLFDKSDEALVNDYEDILQELSLEDSLLSGAFNKLLGDFLYNNPESVNPIVEDEWDNTDTTDKLVVTSPIPLNSEQLQILSALRKDNCHYLIVEGPPGTGKSHTITAVIFDAVLRNQSVLVLSDKKEALDVVEKNITQTMNKVRYDKNFQNPILRLGKTGNTYAKILAQSTIEGIKTNYRAVRRDFETIKENIDKSSNSLKEDLEAEIISYKDINIQEVKELVTLENELKESNFIFNVKELVPDEQSAIGVSELRSSLMSFKEIYDKESTTEIISLLGISLKDVKTIEDYKNILKFLSITSESIVKLKEVFKDKLDTLKVFETFGENKITGLTKFIKEYSELKLFLVGFLFNKEKVTEIDFRFNQELNTTLLAPHQELTNLKEVLIIIEYIKALGNDINSKLSTKFDFVALVHLLIKSVGLGGVFRRVS